MSDSLELFLKVIAVFVAGVTLGGFWHVDRRRLRALENKFQNAATDADLKKLDEKMANLEAALQREMDRRFEAVLASDLRTQRSVHRLRGEVQATDTLLTEILLVVAERTPQAPRIRQFVTDYRRHQRERAEVGKHEDEDEGNSG